MDLEQEGLLAPSDPAKDHWSKPARSYQEQDFDAHRQVYVGVHMPIMHSTEIPQSCSRRGSGLRPRQHRQYQVSQKRKRQLVVMTKHTDDSASEEEGHYIAPASERVRFILGAINEKDENKKDNHNRHELFTELEEFVTYEDGEEEWKETARWFKYEEDVEEGGDRWSKPHVATLSLHSLFEVRSCLMSGTVILDMEAETLAEIADLVLDHLISCNKLDENVRVKLRDTLLRRHTHQKSAGIRKGLSNIISSRKPSHASLSGPNQRKTSTISLSSSAKLTENGVNAPIMNGKKIYDEHKLHPCQSSSPLSRQTSTQSNTFPPSASVPGHLVYQDRSSQAEDVSDKLSGFMKKLPANSEASNVLVGEVDFLIKPITAFIRLDRGVILGDLTEIPIPTRFLFIMMGPALCPGRYHEIGRSISTLMADEVFHDVAYLAKKRDDLIAGIDEFLEKVTVLPPGEWDPSIRIEPPPQTPNNDLRRPAFYDQKKLTDNNSISGVRTGNSSDNNDDDDIFTAKYFMRSKKIFGGLKQDFCNWKDRIGDLRDALHLQCFGSIFLNYFIMLAMILVYGQMNKERTGSIMRYREHLLALSINGILHAVFTGQPLMMIGFSFPLVVFDAAIFKICQLTQLDFLPFRMWIGLWTAVFLLIFIAFGISVYVRYFTRFSMEIFLVAVAATVLYNTFAIMNDIRISYPVSSPYQHDLRCDCVATRIINTPGSELSSQMIFKPMNHTSKNMTSFKKHVTYHLKVSLRECVPNGGSLVGSGCSSGVYFLSTLLTIGTFMLVSFLALLRMAGYLPIFVRRLIGDFAALVTVLIVAAIGYRYRNEVNIAFVDFPVTYDPMGSDRPQWMIATFGKNPIWIMLVSFLPAVFLTVILFVEHNLTAMVANKKENKLKKSYGYHLDLFVLLISVLVSSIFGLPYTVGSAVTTVNHIQSLYIDCADYQRLKVKGVREQRMTSLVVSILLAMAPAMNPILMCIPDCVLYGILIFAGFRALNNVQFVERVKVMAMPSKNQPDLIYLRQVPTLNVYLYTIIQMLCASALWAIRMTYAAVVFPVAVILVGSLRVLLSKLFRSHHLVVLDEAIPQYLWQQKLMMAQKQLLQDIEKADDDSDMTELKPDFGNLNGEPKNLIISEELVKMPVWQKLIKDESSPASSLKDSPKSSESNRKRRRKHTRRKVQKPDLPLNNEEEEDEFIVNEDQFNFPAPWDLPYQSPPRTDSKFLMITDCEVHIDPACSRNESKSATGAEETKSDEVYS